jgi:hypothetical protein
MTEHPSGAAEAAASQRPQMNEETMPNDQPTPRPPHSPPFSRPTHPGYLPVIQPESDAGRPLRPTPYASAVILPSGADQSRESPEAVGAAPRSLRDLPVDHGHPTGIPANPEPAVEGVGAVWDYPADSIWSSDAVFGWGASAADWELVSASAVPAPSRPLPDVVSSGQPARPDAVPSDLARGAAELLEELARAILRGDVVLPSVSWPQSGPAVLAAVLTALLARTGGEQWEAREASASEQRR